MTDWLSYAKHDPIPGLGTAPFEHEDQPTWKLLLHTTEGSRYESARTSYARNQFAPHLTIAPDPANKGKVLAWQHYPLSSRATTLADKAGGIRPNRDFVIQVEIVGFCDPRWNDHSLYIRNWPDWYHTGVAKILRDILALRPIPRQSTVTWVDHPKSYGTKASQRLTAAQFDAYTGILGHQHAPENTHGDPGNLREFVTRELLKSTVTPKPKVSLKALIKAARSDPGRKQSGQTPGAADDVRVVERALQKEGLLAAAYAGDGSFGSLTVSAYGKWQQRCGYTGDDADGIPGKASLTKLARKYGFTVGA